MTETQLTIWKFPAPVLDEFQAVMPDGAQILYLGVQDNEPWIWALVDPEAPSQVRNFITVGTGHSMPSDLVRDWKHVGSYMLLDGMFVGHVFEAI